MWAKCWQLRNRIQDLIDNKLIQFDNAAGPNVIANPLPPHQERNVNTILTTKERISDFSSPLFPWKAILRALAQEHRNLENIGISRVLSPKALEAALPSLIIISPKMFSMVPNLQTQKGVIIRLLKPFPYEDSHHVPWRYIVSLISS